MSIEKEIVETQSSIRNEHIKQGVIYMIVAALILALYFAS